MRRMDAGGYASCFNHEQLANDYIVLHMFAEKLLWCIDPKLLDGELGDEARELGVIK